MKTIKQLFIILLIILSQFASAKQEQKSNVYKNGDKACMIGDSITHAGYYTMPIMLYYATRFPEMKLDFRNVGISGDTCTGILWRMDWDVLPQLGKKNTVSALMIGMNDVGLYKFNKNYRKKYGEKVVNTAILNSRNEYEKKLSEIINKVSASSRKFIIFTPSIYDQTAEIEVENNVGANDELIKFGEIGKKLISSKKNATSVDMQSAMREVNAKYQANEGKNKSIIDAGDRVHPKFIGGFVMLNKWLTDLKEPAEVANIKIDAKKKSLVKSFNCDVSKLSFKKNKISFVALEAALPFPVDKQCLKMLKYINFQKEFNREMLTVTNLSEGKYSLKIDGVKVGEYTNKELSSGINLAENDATPQYKQAEKIANLCKKFRNDASEYRSFFMIELFNRKDMDSIKTVDEKIAYVQSKIEKQKSKWIAGNMKFYVKNKKRQQEMFENLKKLNAEIYQKNKPVQHKFEIEKI